MVEVLLTNLLAFRGVQIKFIEAFVKQLIGANHCLLELGESLRKFELL